jgi:dihydroflavonol-4-reductase
MIERQTPSDGRLTFVTADLDRDDGWAKAAEGCTFVLHVATPRTPTRDEQSLIGPAVCGVERVLRAARDGGVRRVVYTSSCSAVHDGLPPRDGSFDEADWTDVDAGGLSAYAKSKALAERAAWDLVRREGGGLELASVNPAGIFGPALSLQATSSLGVIRRLLFGRVPACPDLWFNVVDVRDVADLHVRAMTDDAAAGERFIANSGPPISMLDIARTMKEHLGEPARHVPTRTMPDWPVRLIGRFNHRVGGLVPRLGHRRDASAAKAERVLGWTARPWQESILDSARSLLDLRLGPAQQGRG